MFDALPIGLQIPRIEPQAGIEFEGSVEEVDVGIHLRHRWDFWGIKELKISGYVVSHLQGRLTVTDDLNAIEYPPPHLPPLFKIPIVPCPGGLCVSLDITGRLFLEAEVEAGTTVESSLVVEGPFGVHYSRGGGWKDTTELGHTPTVALPSFKGQANMRAGLNVTVRGSVGVELLELDLLSGGLFFSLKPYLEAALYSLDESKGRCTWDYDVWLKAEATLGVDVQALLGIVNLVPWEQEVWAGRHRTGLGRYCPPELAVAPPERPGAPWLSWTGQTRIIVRWEPPPGTSEDEIEYEVARYQPIGDRSGRATKIFGLAEERLLDSKLLPDTEYCYRVRSLLRGTVRSAFSAERCGRTRRVDVTAPSAPVGISAEARSSGVIALSWQKSAGSEQVSRYAVVRVADVTDPAEQVFVGRTQDVSFAVTGLNPGTEYCFGVSAVDAAGNASDVVETACATTLRTSSAKWRFRVACRGQDYQVEGFVDLDEDFVTEVLVVGDGEDYNGNHLTYALSGPYDSGTGVFDGTLDWTFEGTTGVRKDEFRANLGLNDTGDIATTKSGAAASCDAVIRFDRRDAAAASDETSTTGRPSPRAEEARATFARF